MTDEAAILAPAGAGLTTDITYFGQPRRVVCDRKCTKAWGMNSRPTVPLSDDPDDFAFLADAELGDAPDDPGTYEGGHGKPLFPERHNKWCVRECERSVMSGLGQWPAVKDFSRRVFNLPRSEPAP